MCASKYDPALILNELDTSQIFMKVKQEYSDQDSSCDWIIRPENEEQVTILVSFRTFIIARFTFS